MNLGDEMGLKDLFKKKEEPSEADTVLAGIQMVDRWLMEKTPYNLYLDATVPVEHGRRKEYSYDELKAKYDSYEIKIGDMLSKLEIDDVSMYHIYELHKWLQVYGTMMFWLMTYAPSTSVKRHVMLDEAYAYFQDVFMKTEDLCKEIYERMEFNKYNMASKNEDSKICFYDGSVGENINYILEDYQDLENCENLANMICTCHRYYNYLFQLSADIYSNVPYLVDDEGNFQRIRNLEKTFANIMQYIHIDNRNVRQVTNEQFFELIE